MPGETLPDFLTSAIKRLNLEVMQTWMHKFTVLPFITFNDAPFCVEIMVVLRFINFHNF